MPCGFLGEIFKKLGAGVWSRSLEQEFGAGVWSRSLEQD
jgi:hypothetical protein